MFTHIFGVKTFLKLTTHDGSVNCYTHSPSRLISWLHYTV